MFLLILAILSSTLVSVVMRVSGKRIRHDLGMLTVNYIVCVLFGILYGGMDGVFRFGDRAVSLTWGYGFFNGFLYLAGFVLIQFNTHRNGVVLTTIFQKLGLLVCLAVSVLLGEIPNLQQSVGFALALAAIVLVNYQKGGKRVQSRNALLWMLLSCGLGDAMSKVLKESPAAVLESQFLLITFFMAGIFCTLMMLWKKQRMGRPELIFGSLIAIPNFFSMKFLLGALETLPAVIVYPVYSVGGILAAMAVGMAAFRERLNRNQWTGIGIILIALVLLNI